MLILLLVFGVSLVVLGASWMRAGQGMIAIPIFRNPWTYGSIAATVIGCLLAVHQASHVSVALSLIAIGMGFLIVAACNAPHRDVGILMVVVGASVLCFAAVGFHDPYGFKRWTRDHFFMRPAELALAAIGIFLVLGLIRRMHLAGAGAPPFTARAQSALSHSHVDWYVIGLLAVMALILVEPYIKDLIHNVQGVKMSFFEAQFRSHGESKTYLDFKSYGGLNEEQSLNPVVLKYLNDLGEKVGESNRGSTQAFMDVISHIGLLVFLDEFEQGIPQMTELEKKQQAGCWAIGIGKLFERRDEKRFESCRNAKALSKKPQTIDLAKKSFIYPIVWAHLYWVSGDVPRARLALKTLAERIAFGSFERLQLHLWQGYLIANSANNKSDEARKVGMQYFEAALSDIQDLRGVPGGKESQLTRYLDLAEIETKGYLLFLFSIAGESEHEEATRWYADDLEILLKQYPDVNSPFILQMVGVAKLRFNRNEEDVKEGLDYLKKALRIFALSQDDSERWTQASILKSQIRAAEDLLHEVR